MKMLQGSVSYDSDAVNRTDSDHAFFRGSDTSTNSTNTSPTIGPNDNRVRKVILDPPAGDSFVNFDDINGADPYPQTSTSDYAIKIQQSGLYAIHAQFAVNDTTREVDFFANGNRSSGTLRAVRFELLVKSQGASITGITAQHNEGQNYFRNSTDPNLLSSQGHSNVHVIQYIVSNSFIVGQLRWWATSGTRQTGVVKEPSATSGVVPVNANYISVELIKGA